MDWPMGILTVLVAVVLIGGGYGVYHGSQQPTFSLREDEWKCTANHKKLYFIPVGKVMIPEWQDVCDKWERI